MSVTIYDLAEKAGVSISTVSKALSDSYSVSEGTKKRILQLAEEIGYRPNVRARNFARQKNGTVIFAADLSRGVGFNNPHMFEIVTGIERYLDEIGYSLILKHIDKNNGPEIVKELMQSEGADGVILHVSILSRQLATYLVKEALPHLVIGKPDFSTRANWIDISHEAAGQMAADYLLDKGYGRILFMMGDKDLDQISARRLKGLITALEEEELPIETFENITTYEEARKGMLKILERSELPEVILCTNNYLAMGCIQSLKEKGIEIPRDIALMTFDNYPFSMILEPTLTAVEVDMFEMGWQAAQFMIQKIKKPNLQTQSFCTTPLIIERQST